MITAVLLLISAAVLILALVVGWMFVEDRLRARAKRHRAVVEDPADVWYGRPYAPGVEPDPVEEAYADAVGIALSPEAAEQARLRALAAADGAEAAFMTPGCPVADLFLAELFPRSKNAPKEMP